MKQIVIYLEPDKHSLLKEEARINRRSMGQQILARAFGLPSVPADAPKTVKKQKKGGEAA